MRRINVPSNAFVSLRVGRCDATFVAWCFGKIRSRLRCTYFGFGAFIARWYGDCFRWRGAWFKTIFALVAATWQSILQGLSSDYFSCEKDFSKACPEGWFELENGMHFFVLVFFICVQNCHCAGACHAPAAYEGACPRTINYKGMGPQAWIIIFQTFIDLGTRTSVGKV